MARKKDINVLCKWTVCRALLVASTDIGVKADIMWGSIIIDTITLQSTRPALVSVCRDYMSRLAPSKNVLEARRVRFAAELLKQYGITPNDCGSPEDHDRALAMWIRDSEWSLITGVRAYLQEIEDLYDLDRIDRN
jgi:hypothetical protein